VKRVLLASGNPGKLREFAALLEPAGLELLAQSELGVTAAPEDAPTFVENALAKARHAARATGMTAIADDSGLAVDALGGAPGIRSARFAGEPGDDAANNERLLAELADLPAERRGAHYRAVIVLLRSAEDPAPVIAEGTWHGRIGFAARGIGGFGYDPLFVLADGRTAAELDPAEKNRLSHRARALEILFEKI